MPQTIQQQLLKAVLDGDIPAARKALHNGANINAHDDFGIGLLTEAVFKEDLHMAEFLLDQGVDRETPCLQGNTPLIWAAYYNKTKIAKAIVKRGGDVNHPDVKGKSPLHFAAGRNNQKLVTFLLAYGADLNAKDSDGNTPAQTARNREYMNIYRILMRADAAVDPFKGGKRPQDEHVWSEKHRKFYQAKLGTKRKIPLKRRP